MRSHEVALHLIQNEPENLQGWEIHSLPGQALPVLDCLGQEVFPFAKLICFVWVVWGFFLFVFVCVFVAVWLVG